MSHRVAIYVRRNPGRELVVATGKLGPELAHEMFRETDLKPGQTVYLQLFDPAPYNPANIWHPVAWRSHGDQTTYYAIAPLSVERVRPAATMFDPDERS